jgi:hypothetical protein
MLGRTYSEAALHERIVMTLEERDQLQVFLRQLVVARASPKDVAAETLIKQACAQQSDALYLLVQKAMGSDLALQLAMAKNAELQAKLDQVSVAPHTNTAQSQATRNSQTQPATAALAFGDLAWWAQLQARLSAWWQVHFCFKGFKTSWNFQSQAMSMRLHLTRPLTTHLTWVVMIGLNQGSSLFLT